MIWKEALLSSIILGGSIRIFNNARCQVGQAKRFVMFRIRRSTFAITKRYNHIQDKAQGLGLLQGPTLELDEGS